MSKISVFLWPHFSSLTTASCCRSGTSDCIIQPASVFYLGLKTVLKLGNFTETCNFSHFYWKIRVSNIKSPSAQIAISQNPAIAVHRTACSLSLAHPICPSLSWPPDVLSRPKGTGERVGQGWAKPCSHLPCHSYLYSLENTNSKNLLLYDTAHCPPCRVY